MTRLPASRLALAFGALVVATSTTYAQTRDPFAGSMLGAPASQTPVAISFGDAIERGLRYNLGVIESTTASAEARSARLRSLAALLPAVSARAAQVYENLSLKEFGLTLPGLPPVTGGFGFQDVRVAVAQSVYSGELRNRYRSDASNERASGLNVRDARDIVVFAVGAAYLKIEASRARLDTATAQLASAQALARLAADRVRAEVAPEIDSLRAQVERQTAEQRVIDSRNDLEKAKLVLARMIGVAVDQPFTVDPPVPFQPLAGITEQSVRDAAFRARADLASAKASREAAEFALRAARAQQHPSVGLTADYGGGGDRTSFNQLYTVAAAVSIPLYTGGRIRADVAQAEQELHRRQAEYEDVQGRIAYDVRVAWLDLEASSSSVTVAQHNQELASRALAQAQDRYASGVTNYLEVVESQETVTRASESLVASVYAFNVARLALARASGDAEAGVKEFR